MDCAVSLPCLYLSQSRNYQGAEKTLSLLLLSLWAPVSEETIILTQTFDWKFTNVHKDKFSLLLRGVGSSLPSCRYKHMARITLFRTEWDTWHYPSTSFPPFPDSHNGFLRRATSSLNCPLLKHIIPSGVIYCLYLISYFSDGIQILITVL